MEKMLFEAVLKNRRMSVSSDGNARRGGTRLTEGQELEGESQRAGNNTFKLIPYRMEKI